MTHNGTDIDGNREERKYILGLCKKIKKAGCTVLLIQKSILRDAYNDLSLHFLAKMGIMVITGVRCLGRVSHALLHFGVERGTV